MAKTQSPIGTSVSENIERKRSRSKRYREAQARLEPFEQIARIVIMRRGQLDLSQQELAERMGTTASVISRIESGQHRTSTETLRRLAAALEGQAVIGFEFGQEDKTERELVAL
jgi:ribosome-binding protein aMBF1 (putative translation factor)